jgi:DNA polymerase-1
MLARVKTAPYVALDTQTVIEADSPQKTDPLRAILVGLSIAVGPGEAYYLPLRHRALEPMQGNLLLGSDMEPGNDSDDANDAQPKRPRAKRAAKVVEPSSIAARMLAAGATPVKNLPQLDHPSMTPLRALLEDPAVP